MYAFIQVSRLALQAVLRLKRSAGEGSALAVVDAEAKKPVVLEMTEAAEREGVVVGLSIPQALARCGDLVVEYRSAQAERLVGELLFAFAYSLAPHVEMEGDASALVDLRGVKTEAAVERCVEILRGLEAQGIGAGIGVAESWVVARLAAREAEGAVLVVSERGEIAGGILSPSAFERIEDKPLGFVRANEFLGALPLDAMEISEGLRDVLEKWGIRTIGALAKLKRAAVGARLGMEGLRLWDRVTGNEERVVAVAELPVDFRESWEFEYDVDSVEPLLFLLRRFLDTLATRMQVTHKVASLMRVELKLAFGDPLLIEQKLPEATSDADALFRLLNGRLEGLEAESPVKSLELRLETIDFRQRQLGLFESSLKNPYRFTQTLSKVAGIVGAERIGRAVLDEDQRPDGFRLEALPASVPPVKELSLDREYTMPLRRFRPGLRAAVEFQGRLPNWVQSEKVSGFVKAARGPWIYSGRWWDADTAWNRIEWDVELNKGGVYRIIKDAEGWKVEGCYG